jgi:hypothetical protein
VVKLEPQRGRKKIPWPAPGKEELDGKTGASLVTRYFVGPQKVTEGFKRSSNKFVLSCARRRSQMQANSSSKRQLSRKYKSNHKKRGENTNTVNYANTRRSGAHTGRRLSLLLNDPTRSFGTTKELSWKCFGTKPGYKPSRDGAETEKRAELT